ncbi:uncharacterized protein L3040_008641 [Drepanopeziza brunnea f. sp. 'multigermtubi']|uniref:uncharacterized protein n=1 Tax=Drepanopeziza brunnea f. sp. 'multigermtubi' TaxID=698441 RepID=UPI002389346E|nr:hypothetical protein L3040_008641 [Drepanopeziza brunnea f. sp. 'multigermtubi']
MAANFQPSAEQVDQLLMLVGQAITRPEALARLKGNNNSVEQALNEYYDDAGSANKYQWDEGQFNSDREGAGNSHDISFNIHAPDDSGPYNRYDGAPSRPPSRTSNNKSPLSKVIDLTAEHAAADPRNSSYSNNLDYADSELEQALAASRADLGMPPQESGITGTEKIHFGPANRTQYEPGQWELVPMGRASAQEIILDPEPADRKREPGSPAFLKPMVGDNRLNAVITIYHAIPLIRNLFLNSKDVLPNYGHDPEWWSGKSIEQQSTVTMEGAPPAYDQVDRELQRLMAFLDNTERSYGSVEALANFQEVKQAVRKTQGVPAAVFRAWKNIFENKQPGMVRQIFSTGVQQEDAVEEPTSFAILELDLPSNDSFQETLYDVCDEVLWPIAGDDSEVSKSSYLSRIAEVMTFAVDGGYEHKKVDIPAVWYPDRYLKPARQAALDMRLQKREVEQKLQRIQLTEEKLTNIPLKTGKIVKVHDLFEASLKHDKALVADNGQLIDVDVDMMAPRCKSDAAIRLSEELRKVVASIDRKLIALRAEREKARSELRSLSKLYTEPSNDPQAPDLHMYTLRGVSTTKNTMYMCKRAEAKLINIEADEGELLGANEQWWRIKYTPGVCTSVAVEKTTEEAVLEAARNSDKPILVYASEKAMTVPHQELPKALETFVRFDNRTFRAEFQGSEDSHTVDGDSPTGAGNLPESNHYAQVNIAAREMRNNAGSGDVIMGFDPSTDTGFESRPTTQEMQERSGIPMLSAHATGGATKLSTVDSMDLDQVIEDDEVARESAAVKHVGFAE